MKVTEPRELNEDGTQQLFVIKEYQLITDQGWVMISETPEWRAVSEPVLVEVWEGVPEEE